MIAKNNFTKLFFFIIFTIGSTKIMASDVIRCKDIMNASKEARIALHSLAQDRAREDIEEFTGRKITRPFPKISSSENLKIEQFMGLIEVFWCETPQTPLHAAWYRFYSINKKVFE